MPELVLLHGWGMNAAVFAPLRSFLPGWEIHALELPGHGDAPWSSGLKRLEDWAEFVLAKAPVSAFWCGWSLGGMVAMQAALMAPGRVQGLLMLASTPRFSSAPDWPHALSANVLEKFAQELRQDMQGTVKRFLALQVMGLPNAKEILLQLKHSQSQTAKANSAALDVGLELLLHADLRPYLSALKIPVRWLLGSKDSLVPVAVGKELQRLAQAPLVIDGAAHAPFLSHPQICARELSRLAGYV